MQQPLIVTLTLDDQSFQFFDAKRRNHFPPARNFLKAHLTLFHHLLLEPSKISEDLALWSRQTAPITLQVAEVKNMGKGVAYKIVCPALLALHQTMQAKWKPWLTPQDKQKLWPHVTVQNKVSPAQAQQTWMDLQAAFQPFTAKGLGFDLWAYEGGPWRILDSFPFRKL
ncbi:MAG TPA: 2'-5' RNA ligase family protein [Flavisolibacter sp.]|nr:2'-5' RNA ligase family protein [Flavisolibacter sp.]